MQQRWQCLVCGYIHAGAHAPDSCPSCGAPFTAFQRQERDARARLRHVQIATPRPAGFRYVIIGNSAAGRAAARAITALHPAGQITVIGQEPVPLYARPLLPDLIAGMDTEAFFASGAAFEARDITFHLGKTVTALNAGHARVTLDDDAVIPYDALLLATGSAPVQVPWPGAEAEGVAYFRSHADARRVAALMADTRVTVVVGGGMLGLEFVRAFHAAGKQVILLVREPHVGGPAMDARGGALLRAALERLGVRVITDDEVARFVSQAGRVCAVETKGGHTLSCSLVGVAVGVRPNIALAQAAGIRIDRGILVDAQMHTSAPGIYAAGDVAQAFDRVWGEPRVTTSWRNALEQGEAAGIAMAGGAMTYPGSVAINYQLAAGLPFCAMGITAPAGDAYAVIATVEAEPPAYRKIVARDTVTVGAVLIGNLADAATLEQQIRGEEDRTSSPVASRPPIVSTDMQRSTHMAKMTEANVKDAFAGESQAHMKYLNFAEKAAEDGKDNVARLFRAASYAEQTHATAHLEVLKGIGATADNLEEALAGESFEIAEMYPAFIAVAVEQEETDAQESFNHALQVEKQHHALYARAKEAVQAGGDVALGDLWVCNYCGFTAENEAPGKCPLCGNPRKNFVKF